MPGVYALFSPELSFQERAGEGRRVSQDKWDDPCLQVRNWGPDEGSQGRASGRDLVPTVSGTQDSPPGIEA